MNDIDQAIEYLKNSPIYAMSLGSKELFHSNFWKWVIEQEKYRNFICCFFENFNIKNFKEIKREHHNKDLVIIDKDNNEYIIENKIKTYATKRQLEEYERDSGVKFKQGILTGIKEPSFELSDGWQFICYEKIATYLEKMVLNDNSFNGLIIQEYCKILRNIYIILDFALDENKQRLSYECSKIEELKEIRLYDVFYKLKAEDFISSLQTVKEKFEKEYENNIVFYTWRGFNRGNATLDFVFQEKENEQEKWALGVQIEGKQFRLFMRYGLDKKDLFELGIKEGFFEEFNDKTIRGHKTSMKTKQCGYNNGKFVYQYYILDDKTDSYSFLEENIINELEKAFTIIKSKKGDNIYDVR